MYATYLCVFILKNYMVEWYQVDYSERLLKSSSTYLSVPGSPLEIFRLFFTIDILQHIVDETNKYAFQCIGSPAFLLWDPLTVEELQAFMGFMILMGLAHLPSLGLLE